MGIRLSWSDRGGLRLNLSKREGRAREWISIPLTRTKTGRKRRVRKGASFRL
jgi:hypothetical protein